MSLTAAAGIFGFGPQSGKESPATTFYRHRAVDVDLSIMDDTRLGPLEVGGTPVPTFPYKAGYAVQGGASIQPRLEDTLGWLLYAAIGDVTSTPVSGGIYDHEFALAADPSYVPYIGARKYIPPTGGDLATDLGETYEDCKLVNFQLQMPNSAPLTARVDILGRDFDLDDAASSWTWGNSYEDYQSIPVSCATGGFIKIDTVELPVVAAQVGWQNQPLDMQQEHIYGDPKLEDVTIIQRQLSFDLTVKWNNPDLYRDVLTGATNGTIWTAQPKVGAMEVKAVSSLDMTGEAEPWSLIIAADDVMLSQQGGVRLSAGQSVLLRFQGVAIESTTYATLTLRNLISGYAWPSGS